MKKHGHPATQHLLALVPNWLGDAVMCTPALRALHKRYPEAQFTVAGQKSICSLLEDLPWITRFEVIPPRISLREMIRAAARLRPHRYDLIVVFPHSLRAALLAWFIGGHRRIGYARNGRTLLLTDTVLPHRENGRVVPVYMTQEYLELVKLAGCEDDGEGLELGVNEKIAHELAPYLAGEEPLIGIAPGAAFGPSKRWMPEAFASVVNQIAATLPARFILLTGPGEDALRETIKANAEIDFLEPCVSQTGLSVLKATIAKLDLLICNDSGPRHIAVAFKRPIVCIMGPTSPRYTDSPYEIGQVLRVPLECSPCQKPVCPLEHHRCMREITPERVTNAALHILQSNPGSQKD